MPPSISTSNRMYFLTLHEYGEDDLLIEEMTGHEAVSQLFEFRLRLLSERDDIDPRKIIAKPAVLRIETWSADHMGGERHWNGVVSRFQRTGRVTSPDGQDLYSYECDIVPWFWFMTQHEDCRIFQNKSAPDIIETLFDEFGYNDYKLELSDTHPPLEYCTQYHETTFDFISRLIEREGIHYYFRHNEGEEARHILVFTDNRDNNPKLEPDELPFHHAGTAEGFDAIRTLSRSEQMRTRKVTVHGWDYAKKSVLGDNTPTVLSIGSDRDLERYRYPGEFVDTDAPKRYSKVIMEAEEASHLRFRGDSQIRTLAPGHTFTLYDHLFDDFNIEYMVLSVWHHGRNNLTGESGASEYANEFTLQPHEVVYRAPLTTPPGLVRGPQTALVVGPSGEEIYTDEAGRVKVRFHWDRRVDGRQTNMPDDKATCWIRVAQMWAGNGYGSMFIPRIGNEVVVDFLEGDPDQPIIIGSVYNGINAPPLNLPGEATRSTIKTLSSKGGGTFNELRFEDKAGSEEIFLNAGWDLQMRTEHDSTTHVGNDSHSIIANDRFEQVDGETHEKIARNRTVNIDGEDHLDARGGIKLSSFSDIEMVSDADIAGKGGMNVHLKAGINLVLDAGVMISLKAGGSSIVLDPSGVSVTGALVRINSGGSPQSAKSANKADKAKGPLKAIESVAGKVSDALQQRQAQSLRKAAQSGQPFCAECEAARKRLAALQG